MGRLPDAEQRRRAYRELPNEEPDRGPQTLEEAMIGVYPDDQRRDWMRRQLWLWRGQR